MPIGKKWTAAQKEAARLARQGASLEMSQGNGGIQPGGGLQSVPNILPTLPQVSQVTALTLLAQSTQMAIYFAAMQEYCSRQQGILGNWNPNITPNIGGVGPFVGHGIPTPTQFAPNVAS